MNLSIDQLAKSILQKNTLEDCNVNELQRLTDQYPYFSAAQLLLTKKLQKENAEQYLKHLQKTSLYFYNPLWLEYLLDDVGNSKIVSGSSQTSVVADQENKEISLPDTGIKIAPVEPTIEEPIPVMKETKNDIATSETDEQKEEPLVALPEFKIEPIDPSKAELKFEPYHTIDYFASQGIKYKEEEKPKDKFSQQLKSFTEWLKVLKQAPVSAIVQNIPANSEQKVEQLAGQSLEDREVVTETMAEVWAKQGNKGKAIEIYNKLSLLDPSKSPYFAAKIEELKKQ